MEGKKIWLIQWFWNEHDYVHFWTVEGATENQVSCMKKTSKNAVYNDWRWMHQICINIFLYFLLDMMVGAVIGFIHSMIRCEF